MRGKYNGTAIERAIHELVGMHIALEPTCVDQGPDTCPAWGAIHGLEALAQPNAVMLEALKRIAGEPCDHGPMPFCPREVAREALAQVE